jgi:hypothetical protein
MGGATPSAHYDTASRYHCAGKKLLKRILAILALVLPLGACGTTNIEPTQGDLKAAWERSNVAPLDYKADILAFMRTYLNDPTNVRNAAVSAPARKLIPGDPAERIVSCLRYDAKKSSGGYAGAKTGIVIYGSGKLDRFIDTPKLVREVCEGVALQPFPELQRLSR